MNETIAVDCVFHHDDRVRVRRIQLEGQWFPVEQGRQWIDENGRHVLISIPGADVLEILLSPRSLRWELVPRRGGPQIV